MNGPIKTGCLSMEAFLIIFMKHFSLLAHLSFKKKVLGMCHAC